MRRIFVLGDLHGNSRGEMKFLNSRNFNKKSLTKEDVVVQLGDFGYYWYYPETHKYNSDYHWRKWFAAQPYTLLIVPGNHENYDLINNLPIEEKWGGKVFVEYTNKGPIYIAKRGEIYIINGKKCLVMGGAQSGDISMRKSYNDYLEKKCKLYEVSYWNQETLSKEDMENAKNNLLKHNFCIDYVFSHTAPNEVIDYNFTINYQKINEKTTFLLEELFDSISVKEWHFGHIHTNIDFEFKGCKFSSHYKTPPKEIV